MIEQYYTPEEIGKLLKVTEQTVRRLAQSGQLKAVHIGKALRVKESDLQAFLDSRIYKAKGSHPVEDEENI